MELAPGAGILITEVPTPLVASNQRVRLSALRVISGPRIARPEYARTNKVPCERGCGFSSPRLEVSNITLPNKALRFRTILGIRRNLGIIRSRIARAAHRRLRRFSRKRVEDRGLQRKGQVYG